ncbi:NmrA family NAD(P)-binding protein [Rhodospirillum sp. A1_3_36]|uniref:NmrA family NAD(P)-binding protein n=1 Tax=Rhodospirillum sp. A1_3_36 TaxID=3391666 RepID=UPI0039A534E3
MIVVTAATGKLGQAVAAAMLDKGVDPATVCLTARDPSKLAEWSAKGFATARADYDDPASLAEAFAGADSLLLISSMGTNAQRIAQHKAAIDAAKAAGLGKVVYTSSINPSSASAFTWAATHEATEADLKASGLPYVILRDAMYLANMEGVFAQALETGTLAFPGASGKVAYTTHGDVAAAAVAALLNPKVVNQTYEITGPEALDGAGLASALSAATGKPIAWAEAPYEAFDALFRGMGLPEFVVEALLSIYKAYEAGEYEDVSDAVPTLTGRPATAAVDALKVRFG